MPPNNGAVRVMAVRITMWAVLLAQANGRHQQCERLSVNACSDLGYNLTSIPNLMEHKDQLQAERALAAFMPLVHYNCSIHLRYFLCTVFAPMCTQEPTVVIPPCRSLCEAVQAECEPVIQQFEFPWPTLLSCSRFPENNGWCLQGGIFSPPMSSLPATKQCPPDFIRTHDSYTVNCSPRCGANAYYRSEDKVFAERWMVGWAWLSFLSTSFTLLTFWVQPARFRYPERPVVFLALCYCLISFVFILRGALGPMAFNCVDSYNSESYVAVDALESASCTAVFLIVYYFGMASNVWWVVLSLSWFLSAGHKWSSEALQSSSTYFHTVAWGAPAILGVTVLMLHRAAGDELTGLCQVAETDALAFVVVPQGVLLVSGATLALLAGSSLVRVRRTMQLAGRCTGKLERLMTRLGVFAILYVCPAVGYLACLTYEGWHRPRWRSLALLAALDCRANPGCAPGPNYRTAGVEVALLRLLLSLAVGVTSGMWVWSGKTCRAWSKLFWTPRKHPPRLEQEVAHL